MYVHVCELRTHNSNVSSCECMYVYVCMCVCTTYLSWYMPSGLTSLVMNMSLMIFGCSARQAIEQQSLSVCVYVCVCERERERVYVCKCNHIHAYVRS